MTLTMMRFASQLTHQTDLQQQPNPRPTLIPPSPRFLQQQNQQSRLSDS
ncbi:hypothetical protein NC652_027846 [Populus alba x Populus x berolinensis]|nr:hypothetical protein NC652_027846 [Populus alba x Populus x berolinensis]